MASKNEWTKLNTEDQARFAENVVAMLLSRVRRDETTDYSGYTISKEKLGEHAQKVVGDIRRGALQPTKLNVKF